MDFSLLYVAYILHNTSFSAPPQTLPLAPMALALLVSWPFFSRLLPGEFARSRLWGSSLVLSTMPHRLTCANDLLCIPSQATDIFYGAFWRHHAHPNDGFNPRNAEEHTQLVGRQWDTRQLPGVPLEHHES